MSNSENDKLIESAIEKVEEEKFIKRAKYEWDSMQMINEAVKKAFQKEA